MVLDPVTGLYYDEARWYSTAVSTFISRDPAQADLDTYRYCGNMPTQATDPSGADVVPQSQVGASVHAENRARQSKLLECFRDHPG